MRKTIEEKHSRLLMLCVFVILALLISVGGFLKLNANRDAATSTSAMSDVNPLSAPQIPTGSGVPTSVNMGMPGATSVTSLQAPLTASHVARFTLTAQAARLSIGTGVELPVWTFNGTSPGPTLRVQQGTLVIVTLVNHLAFGVTIHWHGIAVPNAADGVAGLTQDAVKPGQSYMYRFFANDSGTYWYHSHQLSYEETGGGLYGMLIVEPTTPTYHEDVDYSIALHEWIEADNQPILTLNSSQKTLNEATRPGQWVRLRLVNTSSSASGIPTLVTLVGTHFKVIALDGHDLNGPQWLDQTPLPIGTAQRYDLLFQMPLHGPVTLVEANENDTLHYLNSPALVFGQDTKPSSLPNVKSWFDLTTYGLPARSTLNLLSHFDASYNIVLNNMEGSSLGRMGMTYTLNGRVFPNTGMIMVHEGQIIKIRFDNQSGFYHPMHLHGHVFTVLTHNGKPLSGSPVQVDTILVPPHQSYDVAFIANNPGLWMLHCHNFLHANWGMDMMVAYTGISTPFTIGSASGNFPD